MQINRKCGLACVNELYLSAGYTLMGFGPTQWDPTLVLLYLHSQSLS